MPHTRKSFKAPKNFCAQPYPQPEKFFVRDGAGRVVETWSAVRVSGGDHGQHITFEINGYRDAETL